MEPSCSVDYHHVCALCDGRLHRVIRNRGRICAHFLADDVNSRPFGPDYKLVNGRCPECVGSTENNLLPCPGKFGCDFSYRGGFAHSVNSHNQNDIRLLCRVNHSLNIALPLFLRSTVAGAFVRLAALSFLRVHFQKGRNLLAKHRSEFLQRHIFVAAHPFLEIVNNFQGGVNPHICLYQSLFHCVKHRIVHARMSHNRP